LSRNANPFRIGLFVLICGALILGAIAWVELAYRFENAKTYACYFDESITGLQQDAVINYRGVPVGRVYKVSIAPDGRLVEVLLKLKPDFRVDQTIAAQLRAQGLTGLSYLEIDKAPENVGQLTPKITFPPQYPLLQTQPSEFKQLKDDLQNLYTKFSEVDLTGLTESWTKTSQLMNNLLGELGADSQDKELKSTLTALRKAAQDTATLMERISKVATEQGLNQGFQDLRSTLAAARQATEILERQLKALPPDTLKHLSQKLGETVQAGSTVLADLNSKVGESNALLEKDLLHLKTLLADLNTLVQSLKEQPNRLIFPGKQQEEPFKKK
jgi:phospholipid/cholesterol/gamma-HCH transport system substrate-binding protein